MSQAAKGVHLFRQAPSDKTESLPKIAGGLNPTLTVLASNMT